MGHYALICTAHSSWSSCGRLHMKFIVKHVALVLKELEILFLMTIKDHAHLPGSRKHLRILDRDFVADVVGVHGDVTFDHMQLIAMEIPGPVKPGLFVEIDRVDDQRISLPSTA